MVLEVLETQIWIKRRAVDEEMSTLGLDGTQTETAAAKTPFKQEETPSRPRLLRGKTTCSPGFPNREYFHETN